MEGLVDSADTVLTGIDQHIYCSRLMCGQKEGEASRGVDRGR